jgi:hypothetical protein
VNADHRSSILLDPINDDEKYPFSGLISNLLISMVKPTDKYLLTLQA